LSIILKILKFNNAAKVSIEQARVNVLSIHPGKIMSEEREIGMDGTFYL
jgi:hypothetical protein